MRSVWPAFVKKKDEKNIKKSGTRVWQPAPPCPVPRITTVPKAFGCQNF
jgi:hypothetical protein